MSIVETVHVFPLSDVVSPLEVASLIAKVLPKDVSAESRMIVVDRYSADS
jgi:hypothetical protein